MTVVEQQSDKPKSRCPLRNYYSVLGIKIALPVALFSILPISAYLFYHEYLHEGWNEVYNVIAFPYFWIENIAAFAILMFILSKIVILPLKKFELHISELEKGTTGGPFILNRNDEIGYLVDRFNRLHKMKTSEIEARDSQLSVLYNFTNVTSGIFDIPTLMDEFFKILHTAVEFDVGAYTLHHKNHTGGRIYTSLGTLAEKDIEDISQRVIARTMQYCRNFPKDKLKKLDATYMRLARHRGSGAEGFSSGLDGQFIELPIILRGEPVGIVSLSSYFGAGVASVIESKIFIAMVQHTSTVIERLMAHLSDEERKLSDILSSMSEGVYLIDKDGYVNTVNKKGGDMIKAFCGYGLSCARAGLGGGLGSNCPQNAATLACGFAGIVNRVRAMGHDFDGTVYSEELRSDGGQILLVSVSNLTTENSRRDEGYVATVKDVTDDRMLQKRVMLSSKLAALGEMAAGIAHEVNNPLQVMMANLELLECNVNENGAKRVVHIKDGISRVKNIVRDLLVFAREQTTEVEDVDINSVITKAVDIIGNQLKLANVNVQASLDQRALLVRCNRNLFQQVVINLLQNARDAIEESGKGSCVNIRTVMLPAGIVVVEVADDGPGIPENIIDRIFDPFFTTKEVGKGTGLGLSVSRRIIEGMGGNIAVASSPATGTTFTISLLHHSTGRKQELAPPQEPAADYTVLAGKDVIIVDDEEGVLRAVRDGLQSKVAHIDSLSDGRKALELIMDRDYDCILMDIKMPGLNGMELFKFIKEHKPYLCERVLFLTGDSESETTASFLQLTGCRHLSKPFTMKELLGLMCESETELT